MNFIAPSSDVLGRVGARQLKDQPPCAARSYILIGLDGQPYNSPRPGPVGGHRKTKIYGRLDCPAALRAIARGGYVKQRVFFANAGDAVQAGYRPCAVCMRDAFWAWHSSKTN